MSLFLLLAAYAESQYKAERPTDSLGRTWAEDFKMKNPGQIFKKGHHDYKDYLVYWNMKSSRLPYVVEIGSLEPRTFDNLADAMDHLSEFLNPKPKTIGLKVKEFFKSALSIGI